jgi:hypothetical protein
VGAENNPNPLRQTASPEAAQVSAHSDEQSAGQEEAEIFAPTPRSLTFRYLAILWCLPSFGAVWLLWAQWGRVAAQPTFLGKLSAFSLEQWVSLVLLLLHMTFVGLAVHFQRKEKATERSGG